MVIAPFGSVSGRAETIHSLPRNGRKSFLGHRSPHRPTTAVIDRFGRRICQMQSEQRFRDRNPFQIAESPGLVGQFDRRRSAMASPLSDFHSLCMFRMRKAFANRSLRIVQTKRLPSKSGDVPRSVSRCWCGARSARLSRGSMQRIMRWHPAVIVTPGHSGLSHSALHRTDRPTCVARQHPSVQWGTFRSDARYDATPHGRPRANLADAGSISFSPPESAAAGRRHRGTHRYALDTQGRRDKSRPMM